MRILIIEDDVLIGDGLKTGLARLGFSTDWFNTAADGTEALLQTPYDIVVLDLGLPDEDGLTLLQRWRAQGRVEPVLVLTARGDVDQRVLGLNSGADDYLAKPFSLKEVQARLHAIMRRNGGQAAPELVYRNIRYNPQTRQVTLNGELVPLSPKELVILEVFLRNRNKVLSKDVLESKIYEWGSEIQSNAVEVHVHHLRRKLGKTIIKTINKIGYMLAEE